MTDFCYFWHITVKKYVLIFSATERINEINKEIANSTNRSKSEQIYICNLSGELLFVLWLSCDTIQRQNHHCVYCFVLWYTKEDQIILANLCLESCQCFINSCSSWIWWIKSCNYFIIVRFCITVVLPVYIQCGHSQITSRLLARFSPFLCHAAAVSGKHCVDRARHAEPSPIAWRNLWMALCLCDSSRGQRQVHLLTNCVNF